MYFIDSSKDMLAILQKFGYLLFVIRFSNWLRATILTVINQQ